MRPSVLRALVAALVTLGLVISPSAALAGPRTADPVTATIPAASGQWVPAGRAVPSVPASLVAGTTTTVTLPGPGRDVPAGTRALAVQVTVAGAAQPGALSLAPAGSTAEAAIRFPEGASSTTTLVTTDAAGRVDLHASAGARVTLSVLAHVTGAGAPSPGGTAVVTPTTLLDSETGLGGGVPRGGATSLPTAGVAGLPVSGVRAVWLSVQALAPASGALSLGAGDAVVRYGTRTSTTLVLAPLDTVGDLVVEASGAAPSSLRLTVVGWVAESGADDVAATVPGGLVAVPARPARTLVPLGPLALVRLSGADVPAITDGVLVRATVRTGRAPGALRVDDSLLGLLRGTETVVPLASSATSTVTAVVRTDAQGRAYVTVPPGATLSSLEVLGYLGGAVSAAADRTPPTVAIETPAADGTLALADDPEVTFGGSAADVGSGVRQVVVASGDFSALATLRATDSGQAWELTTPVPAGTHTVTVTATDWAGRTTSVRRTFTVTSPAPGEVVVSPSAEVLDAEEASAITEVTATSVVLTGTTDVRAGDVLVVGVSEATPEGLLRRVESVELRGATAVLSTSPASLVDVVLQADVRYTGVGLDGTSVVVGGPQARALAGARAALALTPTAEGGLGFSFTLAPPSLKVEDGPTGANLTVGLGAGLTASLDFELVVRLDIGWGGVSGELEKFSFVQTTGLSSHADVTASFPVFKKLEKEFPLPSVRMGVVTLMVGPVPVVLTPELEPTVFVEASAALDLTVKYEYGMSARLGIVYEDGTWSPVAERESHGTPSGSMSVEGKVAAGVKAGFLTKVYGVVGPKLTLSLGPEYSATVDVGARTLEQELALVWQVGIGAKIEFLDRSLFDWELEPSQLALRQRLWSKVSPWSDPADPGEDPDDPGEDPDDPDDPGEDPDDPGEDPDDPGEDPDDPGQPGVGFGLANASLEVCRPSFVDTESTVTAHAVGSPGETGWQEFRLPAEAAAAVKAEDGDTSTWLGVRVHAPTLADDAVVRVEWDRDPTWNWQVLFTETAYGPSRTGVPGLWSTSVNSFQERAIAADYLTFWVTTNAHEPVSMSAEVTIMTRQDVDPHNEEYCGVYAGQSVADGRPGERGLHWDQLPGSANLMQLSLEADLVPAGTDHVTATCTITDNRGAEWPEVGSTTTVPLWTADEYGRWTTRFGWETRGIRAYVGNEYLESGSARVCTGYAYAEDGGVLAEYPLIGGEARALRIDIVNT